MTASEHTSRGGHRLYTSRAEFNRWNDLPYGIWTCDGGREVLFNRFYEPIWQRRPGGQPEEADPREWVKNIKNQSWFYGDKDAVLSEAKTRDLAAAALHAWKTMRPKD